ncbi:glutathione-disulfide reductase [Sistotremastrum niveocremeum HHB9708]|uniref:Glutathione-disulfide reductase n=1 Tax=Sistotremastrum niveocremeum HHB9708 TaxID=1314777 RepID=A0A164SIS2_9AGAM|nr:glutathione-disulfide reductase [Sistotremastrum niveocremeum HHB9708]
MSAEAQPKHYDFIVIGGGPGGGACAMRARSFGKKVAIVEYTEHYGGTCVNLGCYPKKLMWYAADLAEKSRDYPAYGLSDTQTSPEFDWASFKHSRDNWVKDHATAYAANWLHAGVELIKGFAQFVDKNTLQITEKDGSQYLIKADNICIATGAKPAFPSDEEIPGASLGIDSDGFFELPVQPKRIAIVGAGYIAAELAGIFHALGTEVHLLIRQETVLRTFDITIQETLTSWMEKGVHIHKNTQVKNVEGTKGGILTVHTDKGVSMEADTLLWAVGRKANIDGLGLDAAGVKTNKQGDILVDEYQSTSTSGITAIGDVCGRPSLTPVSVAAGRAVAARLFGPPAFSEEVLSYEFIPSVVFTHPTIGAVGLTESEARQQYGDGVKIYSSSFNALYFDLLPKKEPSVYKLICVGDEEKIVGLHIIGQGSDEITQGFAVAIRMGATKRDFEKTVGIHPTSAESLIFMLY